jgi:hypothetical protein
MDGNLSAYAKSVGPDEIFQEVAPHPETSAEEDAASIVPLYREETAEVSAFALRSSFGKYLHVEETGTLSVDTRLLLAPSSSRGVRTEAFPVEALPS